MYSTVETMEEKGRTVTDKPVMLCEYAHAQGNSMGHFKEYWEVFEKYDNQHGGFIWDFADQSVEWCDTHGAVAQGLCNDDCIKYMSYAGDWEQYGVNKYPEANLTSYYGTGVQAQSLTRHPQNLPESENVYLELNYKHGGIGGTDSWGTLPLEKYRLSREERYSYAYVLTPITSASDIEQLGRTEYDIEASAMEFKDLPAPKEENIIAPINTSGTQGWTQGDNYIDDATGYKAAFDRDINTLFDGEQSEGYALAEFDQAYDFDSVLIYPRVNSTVGNMSRMNGTTIYGSADGETYTKINTATRQFDSAALNEYKTSECFANLSKWVRIPINGKYKYIKICNDTNPLNIIDVLFLKQPEQRMVKVATDTSGCAWAPESIYDYDRDAFMVYWASRATVNGKKTERIYCAYTDDFVTFTEPEVYTEVDGSVIDTTIYYENGRYNISMYAKTDRNIIVSAEKDGVSYGSTVLAAADEVINGWRKYSGTLSVSGACACRKCRTCVHDL